MAVRPSPPARPAPPARRRPGARRHAAALAVLLGAALGGVLPAGCGVGPSPTAPSTAGRTPTPAPAPAPRSAPTPTPEPSTSGASPTSPAEGFAVVRPGCVRPGETVVGIPSTPDNASTPVVLLGTGPRGVLLVPEVTGDACQWIAQARRLAGRGYRVAAATWTTDPVDTVPRAAAVLRRAGATRIVVVGASRGGTHALAQAAVLDPPAAGAASFSGPVTFGPLDARAGLARFGGAVLLVSSAGDSLASGADARTLAAVHPGTERVLVLPGYGHGVSLFAGPDRARVTAALDGFLASVLR